MLLRASGLNFSYGQTPTLREVGLTLERGEIVALLGPNGSGKSTLIKTLLGHLGARGEIEWEGKALARWSRRELARVVAYLPQSPVFDVKQTVLDVLRLGRAPYWGAFGIESERDQRVVDQVSSQLELDELRDRAMDSLSGGQRQRVFVGRCLVQEPAAILLDEPSTFLDLQHQVSLFKLLRQLAREKGIGILAASHDLNLSAAFADRMVLLEEGAVAVAGGWEKLTTEVISRIYNLAMTEVTNPRGRRVFVPEISFEVPSHSAAKT